MLIDQNDVKLGVVETREAIRMAYEAELDLVEVAPTARPPVARILDYSRFIYEKKRKERDARKKQKKIEIKTVKLKLKTAEFHRGIQMKKARNWLIDGKKVKVEIRFYGREITFPELGRKIMAGVEEELKEFGIIESRPQMEGRTMVMILAPFEGSQLTKLQAARTKARLAGDEPEKSAEDDVEDELDADEEVTDSDVTDSDVADADVADADTEESDDDSSDDASDASDASTEEAEAEEEADSDEADKVNKNVDKADDVGETEDE